MEIKIAREEFFKLISKTQNVVEKRNTMPVLTNVLLSANESGTVEVFATDLEVSLKAHSEAEVKQGGKVVINARSLFEILRELPEGQLSLSKKENNSLEIKQDKALFHIIGMNPDEYPVFPSYSTSEFLDVDPNVLKEMIEKTIYSVSNDETRYHLNGVFFEEAKDKGLRMVATDGHRLSLVDRSVFQNHNSPFNNGVIVPRKGLQEIRKMLETLSADSGNVEMAVEGAQLIFKTTDTTLLVRLIEGKYPNYKVLIPEKLESHAIMDRENLLSSLKRVSLLSNQKSKGVTLALSSGKMEIYSNSPELGDAKEEIQVSYEGDDFKIGFNARYILDVLSSFDDSEVKFSFTNQLSPGLLSPVKDENYRCVVMPMRI